MTTTNNTQAADLRKVFLFAFDDFATDPSGVAAALPGINTTYARELLGILTRNGLLVADQVNDEDGFVWQTAFGTYDNHNSAEAEAIIDAWLAEGTFKADYATPTPASKKGLTDCLCGCSVQVGGKAVYRPGHDARHASQVAKAVLDGSLPASVVHAVLSPRLAAKAAAQIERGNKGGSVKRASLTGQPAWVKVGRWIKQGHVSSVTVDGEGNETAGSEVCTITYIGKGDIEQTVQIDTTKMVKGTNWDLGSPVA